MNLFYKEYGRNQYPEEMEQLYISAFPKEEREDMAKLQSVIGRGGHQFCFYDHDRKDAFVGFVTFQEYAEIRYLGFFAIRKELQNNGYGSAILKMLSREKGTRVALDVEADDPGSERLEEKKRRKSFYSRNGIVDTGISFLYRNMHWQVMSSGPLTKEEHFAFISYFFPDIAAGFTYDESTS